MSNTALKLIKECLDNNHPILRLTSCGLQTKDFVDGGSIHSELIKCTHIKILDLNHNLIEEIKGLDSFMQLQDLYICNNRLINLSGLESLVGLRSLSASNNYIKKINGLERLTNLEQLFLFNNKIEEIENLENLLNLKKLSLNTNQIKKLSGLTNLSKLKILDIGNNKISDLEPIVPFFKEAFSVTCSGNPFTTPPPEIVKQGNTAISNYFIELKKQGVEYLYEAKMLIVGQPRAGKTSLRYKLLNVDSPLPMEDKSTKGIDIERLAFDIVDRDGKSRRFFYNIWDFGGQQIYQTTHQFFLTSRSLYIMVIDTGRDDLGNDDSTINYWLQTVELLGGNSPLLLIRNEKNGRKINLDIAQKKVRFDFLKRDYLLDLNALISKTHSYNFEQLEKFQILQEDIQTELKRLPLVGFPMPKNWVQIRDELQELSVSRPYITRQDYFDLCIKNGVDEFEKQMELSQTFHDLGVFLHFQNYTALMDFIILQNTWATDAVFAILDNLDVRNNLGRFTDNDLLFIWRVKGYKNSVHKQLLALMMQFELCYQVDKSSPSVYILPELLPEAPPIGFSWGTYNDLPVQYRYDFMPKGILTRLIVRMHRHISIHDKRQMVWKTGVKFDGTNMGFLNTEAKVTETWNSRQLNISTHGPFEKELMGTITYEIDQLNNEYFKQLTKNTELQKASTWHKMIPCNCHTCKDIVDKHFYGYDELMKRKLIGKETIECQLEPFATVFITDLLDGVFTKKEKQKSKMKIIKPFVSYSNKDRELKELIVEGLTEHLSNKKELKYKFWSDSEIDLGANWQVKIDKALKESNVAVLLVSASFASSKFINENELAEFFKRKNNEGYLILPILIRSFEFQDFEKLSSLNFFKTYYQEFGFEKINLRHKLMPFDVLGDNENTTDKQLQDYYYKLANFVHKAVLNYKKESNL